MSHVAGTNAGETELALCLFFLSFFLRERSPSAMVKISRGSGSKRATRTRVPREILERYVMGAARLETTRRDEKTREDRERKARCAARTSERERLEPRRATA